MAKLLIPQMYTVKKDFPRAVQIDLTPEEFKALGNSNGLPRENLAKREYVVTEECFVVVRGFSQAIKPKKVRDTGLALELVNQNKPVLIRDHLVLTEGVELPEQIGAPLFEAYGADWIEVGDKPLVVEDLEEAEADPPVLTTAAAAKAAEKTEG